MKIIDVETIILRQPDVKLIGDSTQDVLIVKVHTDEGMVGIGEAHTSPYVVKAIIEAPSSHVVSRGLKEIVVGQDPFDIEMLWERMYQESIVYGRRGVAIHAISAIDIALWDIRGKALNQPIYRLLGNTVKTKIKTYASVLMPDTPEDAAEEAENLVNQGFTAIKFGWGGLSSNIKEDIAYVKAIRNRVGYGINLMIDMGVGLDVNTAISLAKELEKYGIYFLEEPLPPDDLEGYARLSNSVNLRIAAGEKETTRFGFRDLIEVGQIDIIQPDVARAGGLTECKRIANLAESKNVMCIPHCWSTDILVSATLQLIATLPECPYFEFAITDTPLRSGVIKEPIKPEAGIVKIPAKPGLGIEPNEDTLQQYRYKWP